MARLDRDKIKAASRYLEKAKVFTIGELSCVLKCSVPTARLKLKQLRTHTSYNQNGRFYTLPQVPRFDHNGLWHHQNVAFSKYGNLKKTIVHLVVSASAGLTGKQLGQLLGLSPQSFLHHFRNCPGIRRKKYEGVYVYFSDDSTVAEKQKMHRHGAVCRLPAATISEPEAIVILVAIIKHHAISAEEIMALPEIKKSKMKLTAIEGFLGHHGLGKKIPDLAPSSC